jgi:hypothetical protein
MPRLRVSRGISSFIAVLLLMVLAVSAGTVIYSYTMGYLGNLGGVEGSQTFGRMSLDSAVYTDEGLTAYIRNLGGGTIILDKAYVDSTPVEGVGCSFEVNDPGTDDDAIAAGDTGKVTIQIPAGFEAGRSYEFMLVDTGNTQLTFTVKASVATGGTEEEDWLDGWGKRLKMIVDHGDVDSDLSDFPVLVYLSSSSGVGGDDVSFVFDELGGDADRMKIAVTEGDGLSQCYVEIEDWDDAAEEAWLWVKVPSISNSTDTELYLYYDSSHADNTVYVGDTGSTPAENVWDSDFDFVWHLSEPGNSIHDSAGDFDGTGINLVDYLTGKIGGGKDITGGANGIDSDETLNIGTGDFTIDIWVRLDSVDSDWHNIIGPQSDTSAYSSGWWAYQGEWYYWSWGLEKSTGVSITQDVWYHLVATRSGTTVSLYVDGDYQDGGTDSYDLGDKTIYVGSDNSYPLDGKIDEPRTSSIARSAAWIKANYESERDNLCYFGSEEVA